MTVNQELLTSPHRHDRSSVRSTMTWVIVALFPGIVCYAWFFGIGVIIQCLLAIIFALGIESIMLKIRKQNLSVFLKDGSVVVTAVIFALMITPYTPWWISFIGVSFGLVFAKHMYGGLGNNLFNPASTGFIFVLLCYPVAMNNWPSPVTDPPVTGNIKTTMALIFPGAGQSEATDTVDTMSGATPLADMKNRLAAMEMVSEIRTAGQYGRLAGKGWEWVNFFYLLGGVTLIVLGVISWRIPAALLGSLFAMGLLFNMSDSAVYPSGIFHVFSGGCILGAFFVATDPVTASSTPAGKLIYGGMIGVLTYAIRTWGAYPDGVAFAIVIANGFVPLIDEYTRPKVVGES